MAQPHTQADERRPMNPRDQFGRKWAMTIELKTGEPTGGVYPAGWADPLRTPMQHVRMTRNEDGQVEMGKVRVAFAEWRTEIEKAEQEWYVELHKNALHVYKAVDPSDVAKLDQDKFLIDLTGPKPWPSSEVLRQAETGDRHFLGLEPLTPQARAMLRMPTLADLKAGPAAVPTPMVAEDPFTPPNTYQEFVSWVMRTGTVQPGDLKAAAALWKEHRANVAA
jgi:hypothetical protein